MILIMNDNNEWNNNKKWRNDNDNDKWILIIINE